MSRHDRRAQASVARRTGAPGASSVGHNVLAMVCTYTGSEGKSQENMFDLEHAAQEAGHAFAFKSVDRTPLDLARNESVTKVLASKATAALFVDDDCQVDPAWLPVALGLLTEERGILTAPCRLRGEKVVFNIMPSEPPFEVDGVRLMPCIWTGFGCVLVARHVLEDMHAKLPKLHYQSVKVPGATSCAMFRSEIVQGKVLLAEGDPEARHYVLDDHIFSLRAHTLGHKIHATIDVETCHAGHVGNFGVTLDAHEAAKANAQGLEA